VNRLALVISRILGYSARVGENLTETTTRSGTVAIVGRSNVGKSTLLNAALELPLAIVSHKPQTTRDRLLGVVRHEGAEIGLIDTPGFHRASSRLGREMNRAANIGMRDADVIAFVIGLPQTTNARLRAHRSDLELLASVPDGVPVVLVINKIDRQPDKPKLLPLIETFSEAHEFAAVIPISALRQDGIRRVLDEVARLLPEGPPAFEENQLTNRPTRYFAAEYIREPILQATHPEVPHSSAITIERFVEPPDGGALVIHATIHVERSSQKQIMIGKKGEMLKRIGTTARLRLEQLVERKVHLELWVRVSKDWRERADQLASFGLDGSTAGERGER
jgi:GTP-binding protein Era